MVDGSEPSLSFDLKGELSGVNLGEMLRHGSGSNEIGSLIRIAIDGSVSASGLALRGAARASAAIRRSLAAAPARRSRPGARRPLPAAGGLGRDGAVGGVIDVTLGNIMSVLGEKGGVGVGNLLNAISLVLNRFVNDDNALSGHLEREGGVVFDRNLALRATAPSPVSPRAPISPRPSPAPLSTSC